MRTMASTRAGRVGILALSVLCLAVQPAGTAQAQERGVALITGSTDGLGREVARRVGAMGMHVIVHGRNVERGRAVVREIEAGGGSARFIRADLASLDDVRALARTVLEEYDRLDLLINNAGIAPPAERAESANGHELGFAVNYLSGFLLTHLLLPRLRSSAPARIINVASRAQTPIDFDDVMLTRRYSRGRSYAQSKLAQILFTFDLARELEGTGVSVNALHPASLMATSLVDDMGARPLTDVAEGATAVMNLVTSRDAGTGRYFNGLQPARAHAQAYDETARSQLRTLSRRLTEID